MSNTVPPAVIVFVAKLVDNIINPIIAVIFGAALVYFLFGLVRFIVAREDEQALVAGKQHMVWGIIGMTIMVAVYSILWLMLLTFDLNTDLPDPIKF